MTSFAFIATTLLGTFVGVAACDPMAVTAPFDGGTSSGLTAKEDNSELRTEPCPARLKRSSLHKARLSEQQLMALMRVLGGKYLPDYMAVNQTEAHHFGNLMLLSEKYKENVRTNFRPVSSNLITKLALLQDLRQLTFNQSVVVAGQGKPGPADDGRQVAGGGRFVPASPPGSRRQPSADSGVKTSMQQCWKRGSVTSDGFLHMCGVCSAVTQLPDDHFPRFINEAICIPNNRGCLIVTGTAHGKCKQNVFHLNMLRKRPNSCLLVYHNGQKIITDSWELYSQPIRVCCECQIDKRSLFAQYIGP